jgi:hypothetical protein
MLIADRGVISVMRIDSGSGRAAWATERRID